MIVIKGVPSCEKEALEAAEFVRYASFNQLASDNMLYDIILNSNIQLISRKHGIELFNFDKLSKSHYIDEYLFMEVIIT